MIILYAIYKEAVLDKLTENFLEWITGDDKISVTFSQRKYINRLKTLAEKYPNDVDIYENADGSVFGHIPINWLRFSKPKEMSDEQRQMASERFRNMWANKTMEDDQSDL